MNFSRRKLPPEAAQTLKPCPVSELRPYALVYAPVYLHLKRNEKFVGVKAPLDFFTPEELERYSAVGQFYVSDFVDRAAPFREAALTLKTLLGWKPEVKVKAATFARDAERWPQVAVPVNPYELSDAILKVLLPLWAAGPVVEPFFVNVFANEFCAPLPQALLTTAREQDVERYERALLWSGLAVFLVLHLGISSLGFLNRLRLEVFEFANGFRADLTVSDEWRDLVGLIDKRVLAPGERNLSYDHMAIGEEAVAQRLASRLRRVQSIVNTDTRISIFGPGGFLDV